eukprot:GHVU01025735.1.p1 GENE.GHVU01025735.1~~GHVU01025735.1.p1  ORF type:complete len:284 (-),score=45.55 GHVU01025735.1:253-1104(-)
MVSLRLRGTYSFISLTTEDKLSISHVCVYVDQGISAKAADESSWHCERCRAAAAAAGEEAVEAVGEEAAVTAGEEAAVAVGEDGDAARGDAGDAARGDAGDAARGGAAMEVGTATAVAADVGLQAGEECERLVLQPISGTCSECHRQGVLYTAVEGRFQLRCRRHHPEPTFEEEIISDIVAHTKHIPDVKPVPEFPCTMPSDAHKAGDKVPYECKYSVDTMWVKGPRTSVSLEADELQHIIKQFLKELKRMYGVYKFHSNELSIFVRYGIGKELHMLLYMYIH